MQLSATSHLYRAFFDACDSVSISYREGIRSNVSGFSKEAITTAIPSYYSEIRPRVDSINEEIANLRRLKGQNPNSTERNIDHYIAILGELQQYYRITSDAEVSLLELKDEERKKASAAARNKKLPLTIQIAIPVMCSVLGFVLGKIF